MYFHDIYVTSQATEYKKKEYRKEIPDYVGFKFSSVRGVCRERECGTPQKANLKKKIKKKQKQNTNQENKPK